MKVAMQTVSKRAINRLRRACQPVEQLECRRLLSTTYYVSSTGSDTNSGTSTSTPWQTVAKINSTTFQPGDSILFQYGSQFRASLAPISSGTVGDPITFGAYGDSTMPNPEFIGSDLADPSAFTLVSGTTDTYSMPSATAINWVYDNNQFTNESQDALTVANSSNATDPATNISYVESTSETFYYDSASTTLYVNLGGALTGHTIALGTRQDAVSNNTVTAQSNLIFEHLDATQTAADNGGYGFRDQAGDNVEFLDCNASMTGKHAFGAIDDTGFTGENLVADQSAPDQGFGGATAFVSFSDQTRTGDTYQWINCTYTNPNGPYEVFITHGNTNAIASILLQNIVSDNGYGNGMFCETTGPSERITVLGGKLTGSSSEFDTDSTIINGLTVDQGDGGISLTGSDDVVQNCIFTGLSPNVQAGHNGGIVDSGTNNTIRFNTFSFTGGPAVNILNATTNTQIYGNIFDCTIPILLEFDGAGMLTSDHNLISPGPSFVTGDSNNFQFLTLKQWQALGYDANSVQANPDFVDALDGQYELIGTSPAIDLYTGTPDATVTAITTDFAGNPRPFGSGYDAGAYEFQSAKIPVTGNLSVSDITTAAPLAGTSGSAVFTVTLSSAQTTTTTVQYATVDGTAIAGTDYTQASGTLTFAPGVTSQNATVTITPTLAANSSETFQLALTSPTLGIALTAATATATITNVGETPVTFTRKTPVFFTDSNKDKVTLKLGGVGTGTALFISGDADPFEILLSGTTRASSFSLLSVHQATNVGEIVVQGSIGSIAAAANIADGITITGTVGAVTAKNVGGALSLQSAADRPALHFSAVTGVTLTSASPIALLSATNWTQGGSIAAPSIGSLQIKGSFDPDLSLTGAGVALASGQFVTVPSGNWNVAGSIGAVTVSGDFSGVITASAIRAMQVHGNLSQATITLTGTGATPDLAVLSVGKSVTNSTVLSAGNIGNVTVGAITGSTIFAGVSSSVTTLPTTASDFTGADQIASFTVTAPKTFANGFSSSYVAASTIGKVKVQRVLTSNSGVAFGFAANTLAAFSDIETGQKPFSWTSKLSPSLLTFPGDFKVSVL